MKSTVKPLLLAYLQFHIFVSEKDTREQRIGEGWQMSEINIYLNCPVQIVKVLQIESISKLVVDERESPSTKTMKVLKLY